MKKTLVSALTTALVVGAASTTFAAANPFSDVPADHWAYDAVSQLAADGVIEGYGDTRWLRWSRRPWPRAMSPLPTRL